MAGPIHIVIPGTELIRARQLGADIPEVCVDCIVAGRPA